MSAAAVFWGAVIFGSAGIFHLNLADTFSRYTDALWLWLKDVF